MASSAGVRGAADDAGGETAVCANQRLPVRCSQISLRRMNHGVNGGW